MSLQVHLGSPCRVASAQLFLVVAAGSLMIACQTAECTEDRTLLGGRCVSKSGDCGECGDHEFCDTGVFPNLCACVVGYGGTPCRFQNTLIEDPGFALPSAESPWTTVKGAALVSAAPGDIDDGEATLNQPSAICNAGGFHQLVDMPPSALADRFVVEVRYQTTGEVDLSVGFDQAWRRLPRAEGWDTARYCLGEGGYGAGPSGGSVEVRLEASERQADCATVTDLEEVRIDNIRVALADDGECLAPGLVANGEADLASGQWFFEADDGARAGFTGDPVFSDDDMPLAGRLGGSGARISRSEGGASAVMATRVSVPMPTETESPALLFWWKGSVDGLFDVRFGPFTDFGDRGRPIETLSGNELGQDYLYCVPRWAHGSEHDLSFSIHDAPAVLADLVVDRVRVIQSVDCRSDAGVEGFERTLGRWFGTSRASSLEEVALLVGQGRDGSGALTLAYETPDAELAMEITAFVPERNDGTTPALRFQSRASVPLSATVEWELGGGLTTGPVQTDTTWQPNEVCLPKEWGGRWFPVAVRVDALPGVDGPEMVLLDDFVIDSCEAAP